MEAFSAIPAGPVRDSVVNHAQALADAYGGWRPPEAPQAATQARLEPSRPIIEWVGAKPAPAVNGAAKANGDGLKASSDEGKIVERLMRGETPKAVAQDAGIHIEVVWRLMRKARIEGGVVFPGDDKKPGANKSKASKFMQRVNSAMPAPPPPWWWEDDNSPIWDNGKLLPSRCDTRGSMANIGPMSIMAFNGMTLAATRRGMSLRQYVAMRADVVRRAQAGEPPLAIVKALNQRADLIYTILASAGYSAAKAASDFARPAVGNTFTTKEASNG